MEYPILKSIPAFGTKVRLRGDENQRGIVLAWEGDDDHGAEECRVAWPDGSIQTLGIYALLPDWWPAVSGSRKSRGVG